MIIVLSPAKTLDFDTPPTVTEQSQPDFLDQSQLLIKKLRRLSAPALGKLMHISDPLAKLNTQRFKDWAPPFTPDNAKQALLAFNGDVYEGLDANTLTPDDLRFAQDHLRIISGLYGLLRPLDLMQPYRLEMGTHLPTRRGKDLYAFWGERLVDAINVVVEKSRAEVLVNLASDEYFRAVKVKRLVVPVIQPVFEDWSVAKSGAKSDGGFKVIGFYAKRARGAMARFAIAERITNPERLQAFAADGYAFDASVSDRARWVFRRRSK
ncbi:MAG: peroxide stress protein YaaA [Propionivibrio sp.]